MLACGKEKELLDYWYNVDVGKVLGFDDRISKAVNDKFTIDALLGSFSTLKDVIKNMGVRDEILRSEINRLVSYHDIIINWY